MSRWHSLFLYCEACESNEAIAAQLRDALTQQAFTLYDAYSEIPSRSYEHTLRSFVAPVQGNWVRVLMEASDPEMLSPFDLALSAGRTALSVSLEGVWGGMLVYQDHTCFVPSASLLQPFLRPEVSPGQFESALTGDTVLPDLPDAPEQIGKLRLPDMPQDMRRLLAKLEHGAAEKMFGKLSQRLLSSDQSERAMRLLDKDVPDWNSAAGQRLRAFMACLTVPETWRKPDFIDLRNAYMLLLRQRRRPRAPLYPGDADMMVQVPDALDYIPVYGGHNRPASTS